MARASLPMNFAAPCFLSHRPTDLPGLLTLTTALTDMLTGRSVGLWERKHGAAKFMGRDALARLDVPRHPSRTIASQATLIGWLDGVLARRLGAARTRARAARQRPGDVLDF